MAKMMGLGKDPLGRYPEGLVFDLEDNDPAMIKDFTDRGWARPIDEKTEHPGRTVTQIANAMVRNDAISDPVEQEIAREIGDDAHAIVHLEDPDAKAADYHKEVADSKRETVRRSIPSDYEGGPVTYGKSGPRTVQPSGDKSGDKAENK